MEMLEYSIRYMIEEDECFLVSQGFLYLCGWKRRNINIIVVYMDDIVLVVKSDEWMVEIKKVLVEEFEVKDIG